MVSIKILKSLKTNIKKTALKKFKTVLKYFYMGLFLKLFNPVFQPGYISFNISIVRGMLI